MNNRYEVYALVGEDVETLLETDSPSKAIACFFSSQVDYPTCVAIIADKWYDAQLLIEFIHTRTDVLRACYDSYERIPYKESYIREEIDKAYNSDKYKIDDSGKLFSDQVHPFSLG